MMASRPRLIDVRPQLARSVWPTWTQLHLLRAALWSGKEARSAWAEWRRTQDPAALDPGSWQLLPLAWRNLAAQGVEDELFDECRGFYRYHWARNQEQLRQAGQRVAAWQAQGFEVVVLKGAALLAGVYGDVGVRPMADVDLLVPVARARDVGNGLAAAGWRPQFAHFQWEHVSLAAQASFGWERGRERVDLHWHVFHRCTDPEVTREFWRRARPLQLGRTATWQLCAADQLLHACSHGLHYSTDVPIRWLADAAWILRREGAGFDWSRVLAMAERTSSTLALREGLEFAAEELRLPVPRFVRHALAQHRAGWRERTEHRRLVSPDEGGRFIRAWNLGRLLWRVGGKGGPLARGRRMRSFLCARWEAVSLREAAALALRKTLTGRRGTALRADPRGMTS